MGEPNVLFKNVPAGFSRSAPLRVKAATTATDIVALY
jgi:hypothetical protein